MDAKILPTDCIYDNIFHLSEDQYTEYRDLIVQDQKRAFRTNQIATEGNDPLESGKSYGTPHDLAFLYGKESAWNWKALGNLEGTHQVYGIPQGKSEWLRTANPLEQIDWGLRYIGHRYGYTMTHEGKQPNTCKALDHWKIKGWH